METARQTGAFRHVLDNIPLPLRGFAGAAMQVGALEHLYAAASESNRGTLAQSVLSKLDIKLRVRPEDLARVPVRGSAVVAANHPFGMLDGLALKCRSRTHPPGFQDRRKRNARRHLRASRSFHHSRCFRRPRCDPTQCRLSA